MDNGEELAAWAQQQLDRAVEEMMNIGVVEDALVEARPAWMQPYRILIGQVRDSGDQSGFFWVICGDLPTDRLHSSAASTPREAARHFALKWQLEAARCRDPSVQKARGIDPHEPWDDIANQLADKAEALYAVVDDDHWWPEGGGS